MVLVAVLVSVTDAISAEDLRNYPKELGLPPDLVNGRVQHYEKKAE
jgi:hypothetical protein